ncbi:MAG: Rha family transcriptional regulator [Candidatus Izemoplasmatales bacterium]|nr:Rha family transcriptional regulator [Candidatus Izemoplasmatales bacterium]
MEIKLVHTKGQEVFTNSKIIADMLEVNHKDLIRTVEKVISRQKNSVLRSTLKFPQKIIESSFTNKMGRTYKMYELNEQAYLKLAMQLSRYEKADVVQDQMIEAFSLMKQLLLNQQERYYINTTKITNKALELLIQDKDGKPLRDLATITERGFITVVDDRATLAIKNGMDRELPYKEIFKYAKEEVEKVIDGLYFNPKLKNEI